jgi:hypothetical protein
MQKTTALSTAEAEYYSTSTAGSDVLFLRKLLDQLGFAQQSAISVYEDNTACIEWGNTIIGGRERAKHIDIRKHFTHEVIPNGEMRLVQVPTPSQLADILTKGLHYLQWQACVPQQEGQFHYRDPCPQEGMDRQGLQVESRRPLRGVCSHDLVS